MDSEEEGTEKRTIQIAVTQKKHRWTIAMLSAMIARKGECP